MRDKIEHELPFERVPYKTTFNRNKARFNNLANLFNSKKISIDGYIEFFVFNQKKTEKDIKDELVNIRTITFYANYLKNLKKLQNIMTWFLNTSKFIANSCIENGLESSKDFLHKLIAEQKLGQYCLAGKISKYYLAGIPRFDKIIPKLDYFTRCELKPLQDAFDVYKLDLIHAFNLKNHKLVNPLVFVDRLIQKQKLKKHP